MNKCRHRLVSLLAVFPLLFLSSCQNGQDALYRQTMSEIAQASSEPLVVDYDSPTYIGPSQPDKDDQIKPVEGDVLSGELLIKTFDQNREFPEITWLAREFMDMHPNVSIEFEYDWTWAEQLQYRPLAEKAARKDRFYSRIRMELASGEADYILYGAAEDLDYYSYLKNGILADLSPYWENDPDIRPEDYFLSVIDAFRVDGKLPVLPFAFNVSGVYLNRGLLEELDVDIDRIVTVNSEDLLGWYEGARESHPGLQLFFTAPGKDTLFHIERMSYLDPEAGTVRFDSPEFVRFLERTRNTVNDDPELGEWKEIAYGDGLLLDESLRYAETGKVDPRIMVWPDDMVNYTANVVMKGRESFAVSQELQIFEIVHSVQQPLEYVAGPYPLVSTNGHLGIISSRENLAMPNSLKNKDLAWEFLKYCIGKRENLNFDHYGWTSCGYYTNGGIPVTKANFIKMGNEAAESIKTEGTHHYFLHKFDPVDGSELVETMEQILALSPVDYGKYNVDAREYLEEFYDKELTTPEQCAQKLQGRAEIWLNE